MGLLSDFFIADASPIPRYDGGEGFDDADKCQFKGLTPLQGGQLLALLRGKKYKVDMVSEFKLVMPEDAEDWTMSVPPDFVSALAKLKPNEIPGLAAKFAKATAEELGWFADDFVPIISDLSRLARRALETGKRCICGIACERAAANKPLHPAADALRFFGPLRLTSGCRG